MDETYFVRIRGRVKGPYEPQHLQSLNRRGQFARHHEVSLDGNEWYRAADFPELFPPRAESQPVDAVRPDDATTAQTGEEPVESETFAISQSSVGGMELGEFDQEKWYYTVGAQQEGPVTFDNLTALVHKGVLPAGSKVWHSDLSDWTAVEAVIDIDPTVTIPSPAIAIQVDATSTGVRDGVEYAGFWMRFGAAFIDGLILIVPLMLIGYVIGDLLGRYANVTILTVSAIANIISNLIQWSYFAVMESSEKQATFGKQVMGIIVTDDQGGRISFGQATGRHFGKFVSAVCCSIGYIMAGFTEKKQALHDMMAGCLVVRR